VALAKAELAVIAADLKRIAAMVGCALALLLFIGLLVPVGTALFLGEWLFGSMGWGVLHGTLFCVAFAIVLVLGAVGISRRYLGGTLAVAVLLGIAVGLVLGLALPNAAYAALGTAIVPGVEAGVRPLLVGMGLWAVAVGLLGVLVGARLGGAGGAVGGLLVGALLGALSGAITAITFGPQAGAALGVTIALLAWPILAALALRRLDPEALKRRFTPQASIDAARATMDYVQERLPGRKEGRE
jgi:hypothetical protein